MRTSPILLALVPFVVALAAPAALGQGLPPAAVKTDQVRAETVRDRVSGVATAEPWLRTALSAEVAGLVESYPLREGDEVKAGETVVCGLKKTSLLIDLAEAEALLARARAKAASEVETARATMEERRALKERTERDLARSRELFGDKVINKSELDRAESDAVAARFQFERAAEDYELARSGADPASQALQAEVRQAEARLDRVKDSLAKSSIVSPVDGRVVRRLTEVGGWVSPGAPVIEIVTLDPVLVRVGVNERDIRKIRVGDAAEVRVDAWPDRAFPGKVRFVVPEAERTSRSFPVLIEIANPDLALKAGMFARVSIEAGEEREALTVPKDALVEGPMGTVVYTLGPPEGEGSPPTARPVPVTPGLFVGERVVVSGPGLSPGMPVIVTGNEKLFPGRPVIPAASGGLPGEGAPAGGGHGGDGR